MPSLGLFVSTLPLQLQVTTTRSSAGSQHEWHNSMTQLPNCGRAASVKQKFGAALIASLPQATGRFPGGPDYTDSRQQSAAQSTLCKSVMTHPA